jgi:Ca2+-binding EF-hand superfamily protein
MKLAILAEFSSFDTNGDGVLDSGEITGMIEKKVDGEIKISEPEQVRLSRKFYVEALVRLFRKYDSNRDGLSFEEYGKVIENQLEKENGRGR